jgi:hypothetical protein
MGSVRHANPEQISDYRAIFFRAADNANTLLGSSAFRVLAPNGESSESAVNRALLEAQLLACSWIAGPALPTANRVRRSIASLFGDEGFADAVQRATGDRSRTLRRARDTVGAMRDAGAQMQVPFNLNQ